MNSNWRVVVAAKSSQWRMVGRREGKSRKEKGESAAVGTAARAVGK
uniref:Uncharacterized protein n=1 Tax=Arundo donax TaxID=35708 RepID=A0A0A9BH38_ARUDO